MIVFSLGRVSVDVGPARVAGEFSFSVGFPPIAKESTCLSSERVAMFPSAKES
eukprot:m.241114 g.241114  ORF g.241114 m.241114 type:complete len:53 (+) comp23989_c0_seq1:1036-1194(+)